MCKLNIHFLQLVIAVLSFTFATVAVVLVLVPVKDPYQTQITGSKITLPPSFFIDKTYDTPVKDQGIRHASWLFAFISLMQSLWRKSSDRALTSYVSFSEQAFAKAISDLCANPQHSSACGTFSVNGKFTTENFPSIFLPELLKDMPTLQKALFPASTCSYEPDLANEFRCNETFSLPFDKNPLSFKLMNYTAAYTVEEIKKLFYKKEEPLLLSIPYPYAKIYTPTEDTSAYLHCPYNRSKKCKVSSFPAVTGDGAFFIPQYLEPKESTTFMIVGYDDDYIPPRSLADLKEMEFPRGGFIVKGLQRDMGYSILHYTGQLIPSDSYFTCNQAHQPDSWPSPEIQCIREKKELSLCPAATPKPRTPSLKRQSDSEENGQPLSNQTDHPRKHIHGFAGSEIASEKVNRHTERNGGKKMGYELECVDERYCDTGDDITYSLAQLPLRTHDLYVFEDPKSGRTVTPMIKYNDGDMVEEVKITDLPFWLLGHAFEVTNNYIFSLFGNNPPCGYWFIPYELITRLSSMTTERYNQVTGLHMDIRFSTNKVKDIQKKFGGNITDKAPDRPFTQYPFD